MAAVIVQTMHTMWIKNYTTQSRKDYWNGSSKVKDAKKGNRHPSLLTAATTSPATTPSLVGPLSQGLRQPDDIGRLTWHSAPLEPAWASFIGHRDRHNSQFASQIRSESARFIHSFVPEDQPHQGLEARNSGSVCRYFACRHRNIDPR